MKNTLLITGHMHKGHCWFTIKRRNHKPGQPMLTLSVADISLLFPKLFRFEENATKTLTIELKGSL